MDDDKENVHKRQMKRRSSVMDASVMEVKKQHLSINESFAESSDSSFYKSDISESSFTCPEEIRSSCLTDNFKNTCQLIQVSTYCDMPLTFSDNTSMKPEEQIIPLSEFINLPKPDIKELNIGTPVDQIIPMSEFKFLPKPEIKEMNTSTPIDQIIPMSEFKYLPKPEVKEVNTGTPVDQIIPMSEFKHLPKPELSSGYGNVANLDGSFCLNRSFSECHFASSRNEMLNDSFEYLKFGNHQQRGYTPMCMAGQTPETPCDINDIDLAKRNQLPCQDNTTRFKIKKSLSSMSPMFYEHETRPKKIKRPQRIGRISNGYDVSKVDSEDNSRIEEMTAQAVSDIISNEFTSDSYVYNIIDCRYPYEYDGGHVRGAVNLHTPWQMLNYVFFSRCDPAFLATPPDNPKLAIDQLFHRILNIEKASSKWKCQAYIFHCEFSSIRGPEMARCLRNVDRYINIHCYPRLFFPKVYVMKKGYKEFFGKFKEQCTPSNYVRMEIRDPDNKGETFADGFDDSFNEKNPPEIIDEETRQFRIKQYNDCKRNNQEQMQLVNKAMKK